MFMRKYTTKEAQSVGKSNVKSLRSDVLGVIGEDNGELLDLIIGKKTAVTKSKYQCGPGASAFVYSVNEVPFFISLDRFSDEEQSLIERDRRGGYSVVPTVFFFLRLHQLLADEKDKWAHLVDETGVGVTCFGPTSRFLLSGAHLMMPGILKVHTKGALAAGDVALVYSNGVNVPYAVGFVTSNLVSHNESGVGVYIVQCFRDNLWQEYQNRFLANYGISSSASLIPAQFNENEVVGGDAGVPLSPASGEVQGGSSVSGEAVDSTAAAEGNSTAVANALFRDEESVLTFCLCEAIKQIPESTYPLPLPQFTSVVVRSFPRDGAHTESIQFKDTKHKRALPFFQQFPDLLTIAETSPGVHSVLSVNKAAAVMREHNAKYKKFVENEHREACEKETRAIQAKLLESGTAAFWQSIASTKVFYAAPLRLDEDIARVILLGDELSVPDNVRFPTLEQVVNGTVPNYEPTPIDPSVFDEQFTRKTLVDNLRKYIRAHSLLIVNTTANRELPKVKIDEFLSKLLSSREYAPELPLDKVVDSMLRLFQMKHEIVLRTVIEGSSLATDSLVPKRIVKSGALPTVSVWSERATGNRYVTIVRNLEAFGFDLPLLARHWKKLFSASCGVVDPATEMKNLKSGTKIPLEIHIQGSLVPKVEAALLNEANLPSSVIVVKYK
jgi:translation initiation factor 1 (eIF-1/SUI1)